MEDAWAQAETIALCRTIAAVYAAHGCHVALTGGSHLDPQQRVRHCLVWTGTHARLIYEGIVGTAQATKEDRA